MDRKIIISILGSSCSGKSTIRRLLVDHIPDIYHVSFDRQKWLLSNYHRDKHSQLVKDIVFGIFEVICKKGLNIQLEYFQKAEEYKKCKSLADHYGYEMYCFELKAPKDILLERFRARVIEATESKSKISVTSEEIFLTNLEKGYFVPQNTPSFDTTTISPEQIRDQILEVIDLK